MSIHAKLYALLTGNPAVSALIGTRCFPVFIPLGETVPAVVYTQEPGGEVIKSSQGESGLDDAMYSIDCFASTYVAAKDLAVKVRAAMSAATTFSAVLQEPGQDLYDDETKSFYVSLDYSIWD